MKVGSSFSGSVRRMFVDSEDPAASRLGQKMFCAAEDAAVNSGVFIFYFLSVINIQDVFAPEMAKARLTNKHCNEDVPFYYFASFFFPDHFVT